MIKITNLNKYYNKKKSNEIHVINDVSIDLPDTGFVSILGHSGSGKTTLLNVIGGLDKATGNVNYGDFSFDKYSMKKLDAYRSKNIGYIFQNYNLLLEHTVYDNLKIALLLIGVNDEAEIKKRIEYALKAVGMYKYRKKRADALSGGQQQRVSIARALIKKSKVIIADEPTGNLDSNNTIEVMNILKAISKTSLVLMVTHNSEQAHHYSDLILDVKDGMILNKEENRAGGYRVNEANSIYLGDLENKNIENISIYGTKEELESFDSNKLEFYFINGKLYFKNNISIKELPSDINVFDGKRPIETNEVDFVFDNSWYQDIYHKTNIFKRFFEQLKTSYINFRSRKKKKGFINFAFGVIGLLMAIAVCNLANYEGVDLSQIPYSDGYDLVISDEFNSYDEKLRTLVKEGSITNLVNEYSISMGTIEKQATFNFTPLATGFMEIKPVTSDIKLKSGSLPNKGEALVSENIAKKLIEDSKGIYTENDVLASTITFNGYSYKVTGISAKDNAFITINESDYYRRYLQYENYYSSLVFGRYYAGLNNYIDLIDGNYIDSNDTSYQVLTTDTSYALGSSYQLKGDTARVVGHFKAKEGFEAIGSIISNISTPTKMTSTGTYAPNNEITVLEGSYPTNPNQVLVSIHYKDSYKIGDNYNGFIISGFYIFNDYQIVEDIYTKDIAEITAINSSNSIMFKTVNSSRVNELLEGFTYGNSKDVLTIAQRKSLSSSLVIYAFMFIVLTIVVAVFTYFIMRSKMISDIKIIGVYRCLGAKRSRICKRYAYDSFVMAVFTALIGYIIYILFYFGTSSMLNNLTYSIIGLNILMVNWGLIILGGLFLLAIATLFGVLPIFLLLRKTPSEIMSKYDI